MKSSEERPMPSLSSEQVFKGRVFSVDRDRVRLANGREVTLDIVRHPKSVVLIPIPEPGHIVLVRQYRHAVNASLWELPAGSLDPGESPEQAATRECHEEIGLVPTTVVRMAALYPTPGLLRRGDALLSSRGAGAADDHGRAG